MHKFLAVLALTGMACKPRSAKPPPLNARCFAMEFVGALATYQWCQFDSYWYECWSSGTAPSTCKRRQALTPEDRAAAEKPVDPVTGK